MAATVGTRTMLESSVEEAQDAIAQELAYPMKNDRLPPLATRFLNELFGCYESHADTSDER